MKTLDFSGRAKDVKCSTLIICGKKDSANIKSAYYLNEKIENAIYRLLKIRSML